MQGEESTEAHAEIHGSRTMRVEGSTEVHAEIHGSRTMCREGSTEAHADIQGSRTVQGDRTTEKPQAYNHNVNDAMKWEWVRQIITCIYLIFSPDFVLHCSL